VGLQFRVPSGTSHSFFALYSTLGALSGTVGPLFKPVGFAILESEENSR
jgi:hypothetical protein